MSAAVQERSRILMFEPSSRDEVYMLLEWLWDELPYQLVFEEFDIDPKEHGYAHGHWLYARGQVRVDEGWRPATFEFKCWASEYLADIQKHPDVHCDFLVCWEADSDPLDIKKYAEHVIALKLIFEALPASRQQELILRLRGAPKKDVVTEMPPTEVGDLVKKLSSHGQDIVKNIIDAWPHNCKAGSKEIIFSNAEGKPVFRVANYSGPENEALTIGEAAGAVSQEVRDTLVQNFGAKKNVKLSVRLALKNLQLDDIAEFISLILGK